ncbi:MAG: nitroreductase family protein [Prevotellaceae bacterium]|nr:nitroreductase family protein [Prevotellaceae bacterium]
MKRTKNIIIALLCLAVAALLIKVCLFPKVKTSEEGREVLTAIATRTSVRAYTPEEVGRDTVETLLRAAMAAPTAGNLQPWRFVVITDRAILDSVPRRIDTARMLASAPLAIVVCGDLGSTFEGEGQDYWVQDASAATENLLLAAHALGLGAVWCGVHPIEERVTFMRELLRLPPNLVPLNIIAIGHPDEQPEPKDKWKPGNIRLQTWDGDAWQ